MQYAAQSGAAKAFLDSSDALVSMLLGFLLLGSGKRAGGQEASALSKAESTEL